MERIYTGECIESLIEVVELADSMQEEREEVKPFTFDDVVADMRSVFGNPGQR